MKTSRRGFLKKSLFLGASLFFPPASAYPLGSRPPAPEEIIKHQIDTWIPAYLKLERQKKFKERVDQAYALLENCELCPRKCGVNRRKGEKGFCQAPFQAVVFSAHPHFGEERSLVGEGGSGTIFFSNCNLRCVFCQNWEISQEGKGWERSDEEVAEMMIRLQKSGCQNINLVTPTHVMPNILGATRIAFQKGLRLPLVYNTSGYERLEILNLLDGIVDIYMPDMKYMDGEMAEKYSSGAIDYPEVTMKAILEMNRQVGKLLTDEDGDALRGLIIRHLVMPNGVAGSEKFVRWVGENLPKDTYVNIMAQYHPEYKAIEHPEIARTITRDEFLEAVKAAEDCGLTNLDPQSVAIRDRYLMLKESEPPPAADGIPLI
jgi:putative pyruvate formate lyase activating enzyme